jgi:hypothetical protein
VVFGFASRNGEDLFVGQTGLAAVYLEYHMKLPPWLISKSGRYETNVFRLHLLLLLFPNLGKAKQETVNFQMNNQRRRQVHDQLMDVISDIVLGGHSCLTHEIRFFD